MIIEEKNKGRETRRNDSSLALILPTLPTLLTRLPNNPAVLAQQKYCRYYSIPPFRWRERSSSTLSRLHNDVLFGFIISSTVGEAFGDSKASLFYGRCVQQRKIKTQQFHHPSIVALLSFPPLSVCVRNNNNIQSIQLNLPTEKRNNIGGIAD